ncbi:hypothetical protein BCBMB205_02850 [Bacillus sp. CN2]|nr:hypothetical protein BCBMB205_02850 [Bacillus velezensis]ARZ56609.1 hypothetical protein BAGQ_0340 [Bacillus velezensis]GFR56224.1 hypothetical protein BCBMB205_02850 [Bacillus sp. CN2]
MSTLLGCFFSELSVDRPIFFLNIPYFQEAKTSFSGTMSQKNSFICKKRIGNQFAAHSMETFSSLIKARFPL